MTISAKVIADSISPDDVRLTTLQLRYPKFIHNEFMTHRVFSRNASSSRAIPVERLIRDVFEDPAVPLHWGANQKGMQADEKCRNTLIFEEVINNSTGTATASFWFKNRDAWLFARDRAVTVARAFSDAGYHKQIVNRLLEPFCHINVVVTATEWSNFFALRCHPGAQPEMRALAEIIRSVMDGEGSSAPQLLRPGEWHLPYVQDVERINLRLDHVDIKERTEAYVKLSVARCARVSYLTQEGKTPSVEEDLALYDRLVGSKPLHASPCEHQASPDRKWPNGDWERPDLHGNFRGWIQYRKTLPGECS